jgi:hypothetical protein
LQNNGMSLGSSPQFEESIMMKRKTTLMTAVAGAMLSMAAVTMAQSSSPTVDPSGRGVATPQSPGNVTAFPSGRPGGQAAIPSINQPMNPNESNPTVKAPESVGTVRGDNKRLPNPVAPSAANESAPQPRGLTDPTNMSGMEGRAAMGATTTTDTSRSGVYESVPTAAVPTSDSMNTPAPGTPKGTSALPSRNVPASVDESAPQRTGKEVSSAPVPDNKNMPNPKTPANVSDSKPDKAGTEQMGVGRTQ